MKCNKLELHPGKKYPQYRGFMFFIMNIRVGFWMERVISWNNWKVPDPICVNSVCSMFYTKWSTGLRWVDRRTSNLEGWDIWHQIPSSQDKKELNKLRRLYNPLALYKTLWTFGIYDNIIFQDLSKIQIQIIFKYIPSPSFFINVKTNQSNFFF